MSQRWDIDELTDRVADALEEAGIDQASGRVSEAPSKRTIRYYATHGLIDKPADFAGRTAIYDRRHLVQILAVKRLQADGLTLDAVQERLAGATAAEVAQIAGVPPVEAEAEAGGTAEAEQEDFWRQTPGRSAPEGSVVAQKPGPVDETPMTAADLQGVRLGDGVTVTIEGLEKSLTPEDVEAIRAAAEPLLETIRERGLDEGS